MIEFHDDREKLSEETITLLAHYFRSETESTYIMSNKHECQMDRPICIDEKRKICLVEIAQVNHH